MHRKIAIISAVSKNHGIYGVGNSLPWPPLVKDMEMFKRATMGEIVIMGRNTFDSLPEKFKPLPHRINIVISKTTEEGGHFLNDNHEKVFYVFKSIEEALSFAKTFSGRDIFFIGGREIWLNAIKYCTDAFITIVHLDCRFQPPELGPLNFVSELLYPKIAFAKKYYRLENNFSFEQAILDDKTGKVKQITQLDFLHYKLKPSDS